MKSALIVLPSLALCLSLYESVNSSDYQKTYSYIEAIFQKSIVDNIKILSSKPVIYLPDFKREFTDVINLTYCDLSFDTFPTIGTYVKEITINMKVKDDKYEIGYKIEEN